VCAVTVTKCGDCGISGPMVGHVGDGNFHVLLLLDKDSEGDINKAKTIASNIAE